MLAAFKRNNSRNTIIATAGAILAQLATIISQDEVEIIQYDIISIGKFNLSFCGPAITHKIAENSCQTTINCLSLNKITISGGYRNSIPFSQIIKFSPINQATLVDNTKRMIARNFGLTAESCRQTINRLNAIRPD